MTPRTASAGPPRDRRRVVIERVSPQVDGGRFPIKRIIGEPIAVEADVFADGHDVLRVVLLHRVGRAGRAAGAWTETPMRPLGNDRWAGRLVPAATGELEYAVAGWVDRFESWRHEVRVKFEHGDDVASELAEGAALVRRAADHLRTARGSRDARPERAERLARLRDRAAVLDGDAPQAERVALATADDLAADVAAAAPRPDVVMSPPLRVRVERDDAAFAAWYEMFPRSETPDPSRSATFAEAARRLPAIAAMGFDVVYLPPIHPIGRTARKGPNNTLSASRADPGSPWAIGAAEGGHTAVHPGLGTLDDFAAFVRAADAEGLEVALDIAFQCAPDHPWVREHPEWFRHRPDGTIKHAENPPKKYQDIVPFDFECEAWESLWDALRDVFLFWVEWGVRTFRVDNPHTKPFAFWEWVIAEVQRRHPDTVFLSEAFTRPKIMQRLAKAGFTQSYTYFTWRNTKAELVDYLTELTRTELREYMRPNLFANTPDILHAYLQDGGRPAFEVRLILAATLASLYGIYSGFELAEHVPVRRGSEEYLDSEKYQIRPRDWHRPDSLAPLIARVNAIRRAHPAFRPGGRLAFHATDSDLLLCYSRETEDGRDRVLVVVNLDPHHMQHGWVTLPVDEWGVPVGAAFAVRDELTGEAFLWRGSRNYVRLAPGVRSAHIFTIEVPEGRP